MDQTLPPRRPTSLMDTFRSGIRLFTQLVIGAMLIFMASFVAMMTALAGLMLAAAALVLRYAAVRKPVPVRVKDAPVTLQARRTPRGWTVE